MVVGENDAATVDPIAAKCWDSELNSDKLSDHLMGDTDIRFWRCIECGKTFERQIYVMCRKGSTHACEPCSKKIGSRIKYRGMTESGNNLLDEFPEVAKWWDYRNNPDRPEDNMPNSERERSWICSKCGKSYKSRIIVRTRNGGNTECSACGKKRGGEKNRVNALKNGENTLASKYPGLAKEWHPTLNGNLKPSDIPPQYDRKVWWYCDKCGQGWQREPMTRIRGDKGCPYCTGRWYCKGVNDIVTLCPKIVPAWHPKNEKKPENYRCKDRTKVRWICPSCGEESYGSIYNKVKSGSPLCRKCKSMETKCKRLS